MKHPVRDETEGMGEARDPEKESASTPINHSREMRDHWREGPRPGRWSVKRYGCGGIPSAQRRDAKDQRDGRRVVVFNDGRHGR